MFKKILVAFDGSKQSEKALQYALDFAKKSGAEITALYVAEQLPIPMEPTSSLFIIQQELNALGELELKKADFLAGKAGVKVKTDSVKGHPVEEVLKYAKKGGFDVIMLGARGVGGAERLLLGSVSDSVVHHAHCAVLVVK